MHFSHPDLPYDLDLSTNSLDSLPFRSSFFSSNIKVIYGWKKLNCVIIFLTFPMTLILLFHVLHQGQLPRHSRKQFFLKAIFSLFIKRTYPNDPLCIPYFDLLYCLHLMFAACILVLFIGIVPKLHTIFFTILKSFQIQMGWGEGGACGLFP